MSEDTLSLSMFWAGALMVFAPIVFFGIVIGVWWVTKKRQVGEVEEAGEAGEVDAPPRQPR